MSNNFHCPGNDREVEAVEKGERLVRRRRRELEGWHNELPDEEEDGQLRAG